jgi:hypothetical protein
VSAFLKLFLDIVLWRRGPQDLPASRLLLWLTALAYVAVSAVQLAAMGETGLSWFVFLVVDPLLLTACVWLMLKLYGHPERFLQTASAVLGTGALLALVLYLPLQLAMPALGSKPDSAFAQVVALVLLGSFAFVTGRILKLGTGSNLFTGVAFALTYYFMISSLLGLVQGGGN